MQFGRNVLHVSCFAKRNGLLFALTMINPDFLSLDRVKSKTIKLVFVASPLCRQFLGVRGKPGSLGIGIMCPR